MCDENGVCVDADGTDDGGVGTNVPSSSTAVDPSVGTVGTGMPATSAASTGGSSGVVDDTGVEVFPDECAECIAIEAETSCPIGRLCAVNNSCRDAVDCPVQCIGLPAPALCLLGCCELAGDWLAELQTRLQCAQERCDACIGVALPDACRNGDGA